MQKWEYKSLVVYKDSKTKKWGFNLNKVYHLASDLVTIMNQLGAEGWEMTGIVPFVDTEQGGAFQGNLTFVYTSGYNIYFKRPVS
ncbi:MAG: DUF4177 domain-containing protein [Chloroflexota bacterium]|nr:DUF4177 domain-containing protein [Chloroflexota bacterium]MDQ5866270.1 DUF4177 domain-containing protein [Chloroflexota bacterium]